MRIRSCTAGGAFATLASLAFMLTATPTATAQPANDLCANATAVTGDQTLAFDTTSAGTDGPDDPTNPCNSAASDTNIWKDVWYQYTVGADGTLVVSTCNTAMFDTKIIAYNTTSCDGATLIANTILCNEDCAADPTFFSSTLTLTGVTSGQILKVRLGGFDPNGNGSSPEFGPGNISFALVASCDSVACQPGDVLEGEPCDDSGGTDVNGGCNSTPPVFTTINPGETMCGEAWGLAGTRDTDWHQTIVGSGTVSATLTTALDMVVFVVDGIATCSPAVIGVTGNSVNCIPSTASADVEEGLYVIFVATNGFDGFPCATTANTYRVSLDAPEPSSCFGATGDCGVAHGGMGCDNLACCQAVCESDPSCCDVSWDQDCADASVDVCTPCNIGEGDCFQTGGNGSPGCDDPECCEIVCAAEPFCCAISWDGFCAETALELCDACPSCDASPQGGDGIEGESCGDDTNGGCNSTPPAFGAIAVGGTAAGTGWADGGARDTDWYLFAAPGGTVTATLVSEFNGVVFLVDGIAECIPAVVGVTGAANNCVAGANAEADLAAGDYVVFVAPAGFSGTPCCPVEGNDSTNQYRVTLAAGGGCFGDTNGDNVINVDDLVNVILDWGTNGAANGGDVNGSGLVDVDDLVDVILAWGPC